MVPDSDLAMGPRQAKRNASLSHSILRYSNMVVKGHISVRTRSCKVFPKVCIQAF